MSYAASRVADLTVTYHAAEQMKARCVGLSDVEAALLDPGAVTYPSRGQKVVKSGDLTLVVSEDDPERLTVVTVLLNTLDRWTDEDARRTFNQRQAS